MRGGGRLMQRSAGEISGGSGRGTRRGRVVVALT